MRVFISLLMIFLVLKIGSSQQMKKLSKPSANKKELSVVQNRISSDIEITKITKSKKMILKSKSGSSTPFKLIDLNTGLEISNPRLNDPTILSMNFSQNNQFLLLKKKLSDKQIMEVVNLETDVAFSIDDPFNDIFYADVVDSRKFTYWIKPENDRFKFFLKNSRSNNKIEINGMNGIWASNGKYFLIETYGNDELTLREKVKYKRISRTELKTALNNGGSFTERIPWVYCIYSEDGELLVKLDQFSDYLDLINWSPDSKKLVVKERGDSGIYLVYINSSLNKIEIEKTFHFNAEIIYDNSEYWCSKPKWSADSERILFKLTKEGEHGIIDDELWILNIKDNTYSKVYDFNDTMIKKFQWTGLNQVIVSTLKPGDNVEIINQLDLQ